MFFSSPDKPIFTSNPVFLFLFFGRLLPVNIGLFLKPEALNKPLFIRSVAVLSLLFPASPSTNRQVIERYQAFFLVFLVCNSGNGAHET